MFTADPRSQRVSRGVRRRRGIRISKLTHYRISKLTHYQSQLRLDTLRAVGYTPAQLILHDLGTVRIIARSASGFVCLEVNTKWDLRRRLRQVILTGTNCPDSWGSC